MPGIHQVQVLWSDCDPAGILFYGHYFRWMDDATYFLFLKAGYNRERIPIDPNEPRMPLVSAHADFPSPARLGNVLTIESRVSQWGKSSFTVTHLFRHGERVTGEGWEKRVWCIADPKEPGRLIATPVPGEVRRTLDAVG